MDLCEEFDKGFNLEEEESPSSGSEHGFENIVVGDDGGEGGRVEGQNDSEPMVPLGESEEEGHHPFREVGANETVDDVLQLQKANSELREQLELKEKENKRLKEKLLYFKREYPSFKWRRARERWFELVAAERREWWLELLEAKRVSRVVEGLLADAAQLNEDIHGKDEDIASLTRRIEKLKEVNRIRDMETGNWNAGGGGRDAVAILPEEVWLKILEKVPDHKDLWNCSNTCALFKKILHDWKKPTWLFMHALPYLFQYLPQNKILECRLVSRGWDRMVVQYLENHPCLRPRGKDVESQDTRIRRLPFVPPMQLKKFHMLNRFDFRGSQEMLNNVFQPENPGFSYIAGRNPFLGKAVTLVIGLVRVVDDNGGDEDDGDDGDIYNDLELQLRAQWELQILDSALKEVENSFFWKSIKSFLKSFGQHIWYLTLDSNEGTLGGHDDYERGFQDKMLKLLTVYLSAFVPNLRKLRILASPEEGYGKFYDNIDIDALPPLPKLETIEAIDTGAGEHLLLEALLKRHHSTLKAVHLTGAVWRTVWVWNLTWSNLTELHLDHLEDQIDFEMLVMTEDGGGVGLPHLRKLGVNLRGMHKSLDWLLVVIHKFFPATPLDTLRLSGGIQANMFQRLWWKSCMSPTLKTLEVEHGEGDGFYNFLTLFPLVENVHVFLKEGPPSPTNPQPRPDIQIAPTPDEDEEEEDASDEDEVAPVEVDVNKHINQRMYQFNIWELMPRLKLFTFQWDVYMRSGYEQFMEENIVTK